ncbi:MAG: type II toxin-antitoxin system HipA family toxin YjjJ [Pseudomonadota bacterium]
MAKRLDYSKLGQELMRVLALEGPTAAGEASRRLGISQPAFSRLAARNRGDLLFTGRARSTRYAARRTIPSVGRSVPIYEIDEAGKARRLATLQAIQPRGFFVETTAGDMRGGFYDDLPYFLDDLRPAGFLGRLIPLRHPDLGLGQDIRQWTADHCLIYLTRFGWSLSGNLVLGEEAFRLYLSNTRTPPDLVEAGQRRTRYPAMVGDLLSAGAVGSSAAGEQPKFLVARAPGPVAVLVKFSPPLRDETGRRLADLLVCEHIAHNTLRDHDRPTAKSEILPADDRIFLEVQRFDRLEGGGRRGLLSLAALEAEFVGAAGSWSGAAAALLAAGHVDETAFRHVQWIECFGRLIANTDMHPRNFSFYARGTRILGPAPVYDMLPMMYAPHQGHLMDQRFRPPIPGPADAAIWDEACRAARDFWSAVASHPLVSKGFQKIARSNAVELDGLANMGRLLPR